MIVFYNPVSNPPKKPVLPMSVLSLGAVIEGEIDYRIVDGNLVPRRAESGQQDIPLQPAGNLRFLMP